MASPVPASVPVLVTGASSGIGAEFARRFAERGHSVTIVARRLDRLEQLARETRPANGGSMTALAADLETPAGRKRVQTELARGGPWVLVNNAGYGTRGRAVELDAGRELAEVQLNVVALHELTFAVLPALAAAGAGGIINVASTAAFQPLPYMATYGATKAFILHFTEGLAEEMRGTGVRVMALCPGPTQSEFGEVAGVNDYMEMMRGGMSAAKCVNIALNAFDRSHAICVTGLPNAILALGPRFAPRALTRRISGAIFYPRNR